MDTICLEQAYLKPTKVETKLTPTHKCISGQVSFEGLVQDTLSVDFAISTLEIMSNVIFERDYTLTHWKGLAKIKAFYSEDLILTIHANPSPQGGIDVSYKAYYRLDEVSVSCFESDVEAIVEEFLDLNVDYCFFNRPDWEVLNG